MFYKLLHNIKYWTRIPKDRKKWPYSWRQILLKQYPRFNFVELPTTLNKLGSFEEILQNRSSKRSKSNTDLTLKEISTILFYGAGMQSSPKEHTNDTQEKLNDSKRFYPSAGARYPLEVYVLANKIHGLDPNVYHYNVINHTLEEISNINKLPDLLDTFSEKWIKDASAIILFSSIQYRSSVKYNDQGYFMSLVEVGHMAQNILLSSTSLNLASCPIFGINRQQLHDLLDFDSDELVLYATVIN